MQILRRSIRQVLHTLLNTPFTVLQREINHVRLSGIFVKLSHSFHSFPSLCFESKLFPSWNNLCLAHCKKL